MGRQASFVPDVFEDICNDIAEGSSLRAACEIGGRPTDRTVRNWLVSNEIGPLIFPQYERARAAQADYYADEIVEIADKAKDANLARVQIDARKWVAAKLLPKKYGDRAGEPGQVVNVNLTVTPDNTVEAARRVAFLLEEAKVIEGTAVEVRDEPTDDES